ncbi:MAG: nuclear transport factor 2 family protein [Saprospiraceae bacterium]|nr:nuclear transport factor 2 family protein [Saprospiraceae bacterium]MCB0542800.1 nuclear transport factor 2 family protein [Saprospiraceae bacterium]MCB0576223.1 nuclear transport factor 2 family protein [Saprospiraceae bacterium]MCB9305677.1 nuclear transport factor 2 family protein [Lewinellaceae bacterium]MCB9354079.1 nuclear transport factor 2 family protein [Lewinellaceae bacterium]
MKTQVTKMLMVLLFLSTLCPYSCRQPAFDLEAVKQYIGEANKRYGERTKGIPAFFAAAYTRDAWVMPAGVPKITGMDNIIAYFKAPGDAVPYSVTVRAEEVFGHEDNVIETGVYELTDAGGKCFEKGKFVVIWRKEDGLWKIHREIWTSDLTG